MGIDLEIYEKLEMLSIITNQSFDSLVEAMNQLMALLSEPIELISDYFDKLSKRKSYKPVKVIKPNKLLILSKKLNIFYCRNNC